MRIVRPREPPLAFLFGKAKKRPTGPSTSTYLGVAVGSAIAAVYVLQPMFEKYAEKEAPRSSAS
ncbi:hypothetical protein DFS34DRAFT_648379 [Phlyctochytrium arcticum]|nr:hypothetical protein DFS34DRAFT_648379 [Phlyctochytrium arcticum]